MHQCTHISGSNACACFLPHVCVRYEYELCISSRSELWFPPWKKLPFIAIGLTSAEDLTIVISALISLPVTPPAISTIYGAIAMSMPTSTKSLNGDTYQRVDDLDSDEGEILYAKRKMVKCMKGSPFRLLYWRVLHFLLYWRVLHFGSYRLLST